MSLQPGEQLDHYRIEELVSRSGMASIFRATDMRTGRQVAIKIPHPEMEADPVLFDRFKREGEIGEAFDHPGVMKVFADDSRSAVYMVMEWGEGRLHVQPSTPAQTRSHGWLFAVADGVGGQDSGEVAARIAVESLLANCGRHGDPARAGRVI